LSAEDEKKLKEAFNAFHDALTQKYTPLIEAKLAQTILKYEITT
jgi:hypothetical protein